MVISTVVVAVDHLVGLADINPLPLLPRISTKVKVDGVVIRPHHKDIISPRMIVGDLQVDIGLRLRGVEQEEVEED